MKTYNEAKKMVTRKQLREWANDSDADIDDNHDFWIDGSWLLGDTGDGQSRINRYIGMAYTGQSGDDVFVNGSALGSDEFVGTREEWVEYLESYHVDLDDDRDVDVFVADNFDDVECLYQIY